MSFGDLPQDDQYADGPEYRRFGRFTRDLAALLCPCHLTECPRFVAAENRYPVVLMSAKQIGHVWDVTCRISVRLGFELEFAMDARRIQCALRKSRIELVFPALGFHLRSAAIEQVDHFATSTQ